MFRVCFQPNFVYICINFLLGFAIVDDNMDVDMGINRKRNLSSMEDDTSPDLVPSIWANDDFDWDDDEDEDEDEELDENQEDEPDYDVEKVLDRRLLVCLLVCFFSMGVHRFYLGWSRSILCCMEGISGARVGLGTGYAVSNPPSFDNNAIADQHIYVGVVGP
jgi:hypothetical protein